MEVMKALYPPEGGSPRAFVCCERVAGVSCFKVTKTQRGMWMHLRRKHKVKKQADFVFEVEVPMVEPVLSRSGDPQRKHAAA